MSERFLEALAGTRIYPLTDRVISGVSHASQVCRLGEVGATLIQLREKHLSSLEFYNEAAEALRSAHERGITVIINDRVDLALALNAAGVHLGQDDLPPAAARSLLGSEAIIGISTHNLEQARLAANMPVDYVAIGPIFATSTKQSANLPVGLKGLQRVREVLGKVPLVAIGGISPDNVESVLASSCDAVAIISGLWIPHGQLSARAKDLIHS